LAASQPRRLAGRLAAAAAGWPPRSRGGWLAASQPRRLAGRLAAAAAHLLAHVLDHLPAPRLALQALGHVLAELPDRAAAPGAAAGCGVDDPLAREVLRQRPAGRLARSPRARRGCRRREL